MGHDLLLAEELLLLSLHDEKGSSQTSSGLVDVRGLGDEVDLAADRLQLARDVAAEHLRTTARRLRPASEDLGHRRLPGAVVAEQPEDLALRIFRWSLCVGVVGQRSHGA